MTTKRDYWQVIQANADLGTRSDDLLRQLYAPQCAWSVCAPFGEAGTAPLIGLNTIKARFFDPLVSAFPDLERRTEIILHGTFNAGEWIASQGWLVGSFQHDLVGIPASGRPHWLRYGWFDRLVDGKVVESIILLDLPRLMMECGVWPLRPQLGETWSPAPATQDGICLTPADPDQSEQSLKLVEAMIAGLMSYDQKSLSSMGMTRFWTPQFQWYGPAGIGSARGHRDYERAHQQPFLTAFPDRVGGNHRCRIGDGAYVASTGWPSIRATHLGDGWLGIGATGKPITMRIMDFWRADGALLSENWVFIDMIDLLAQFDIDVLAHLSPQKAGALL
jgi:predicted ester cyclase